MKPSIRGLASGTLGALASLLAKLAFRPDVYVVNDTTSVVVEAVVRVLLFAAMLGCNTLMLGTLVQSMEGVGSVAGSSLATAANFVTSAFFGWLIWNEEQNGIYALGLIFIICGAILLSTVKVVDEDTEKKGT